VNSGDTLKTLEYTSCVWPFYDVHRNERAQRYWGARPCMICFYRWTWTGVLWFILKLYVIFCLVQWICWACCRWSTWTLFDTALGDAIFYFHCTNDEIHEPLNSAVRPFNELAGLFAFYLKVNFLIFGVVVSSHFSLITYVELFVFPILLLVAWAAIFLFHRFIFASSCLFSHCFSMIFFIVVHCFFLCFLNVWNLILSQ
jgi:hypothetical protein